MLQRKRFYQSVADRMSGKTGELVGMLPDAAMFRTDPYDEGLASEWYEPGLAEKGWRPIKTTRSFYSQGYLDERGHPYVGFMWYRLSVDVPASAAGKRVMLYAAVAESEAWGWINGGYVGHRPYKESYVRPIQMEFDVTEHIRPGQRNEIVIRVDTGPCAMAVAAGLQSRLFLYSPVPGPE